MNRTQIVLVKSNDTKSPYIPEVGEVGVYTDSQQTKMRKDWLASQSLMLCFSYIVFAKHNLEAFHFWLV